jgi:hypothetical protein
MFSYISTPNEKSFNAERVRMVRGDGNSKIKEQFQSTEDDNFGEDTVRVTLLLADRKAISKHFSCGQRVAVIGGEFDRAVQEFADKSKTAYYAIVGFETVPFNYNLCELINSNPTATFQQLLDHGIRELAIAPALLRRPISY